MSLLRRLRNLLSGPTHQLALEQEPEAPSARDALAAIRELSQAVQNDPNAVEIYLALGNLYRQQGDIERAVQIRNTLIVRPNLASRFKARAFFELGRDFRRSGVLDRAQQAFVEARSLGADPQEIALELAQLAVDSGDFAKASHLYGKLRNPAAQAYYLTRHADELLAAGQTSEAKVHFGRALRLYSGAVEAWVGLLLLHLQAEDWRKSRRILNNGLENSSTSLQFLFFEGILRIMEQNVEMRPESTSATMPMSTLMEGTVEASPTDIHSPAPHVPTTFGEHCTAIALEAIERQEPELILLYYAALFLRKSQREPEAIEWLAKALVLRPDFWAARLELLSITKKDQSLLPVFKAQLEYFLIQVRSASRFICCQCGFRGNNVFYLCPRCHSWHSIIFRVALQD